jgi:hypothetical protein
MPLRTIEEPVKDRLILFPERPLERCPATAFCFNKLAKRRQRLAHGSGLQLEQWGIEHLSLEISSNLLYQQIVDAAIKKSLPVFSLEPVLYCVMFSNPDNLHPIAPYTHDSLQQSS